MISEMKRSTHFKNPWKFPPSMRIFVSGTHSLDLTPGTEALPSTMYSSFATFLASSTISSAFPVAKKQRKVLKIVLINILCQQELSVSKINLK